MNQPDEITPTPQPVSTVTKHIKIYSDNPIHDCIDLIIDACTIFDEFGDNQHTVLWDLCAAAKELECLGLEKLVTIAAKQRAQQDEQKPN
jgi:hypothetical protein